jgi:L-ascorbate metabolism protein UlaG (beta-lactamase superfamily)
MRAAGEPLLYIAGDTIWCPEVDQALRDFAPDVAILNAGAAQFLSGGPITMDAGDVIQVAHAAPQTELIAVHMEAVNHCLLSRAELRDRLATEGLDARVMIPADGALIEL